jgi:hypothetical protein
MKAAITILPVLLMTCFLAAHPAYGWDCSVALDGPTWVKIGRTIQLTASGLPEGGAVFLVFFAVSGSQRLHGNPRRLPADLF